MKDGIEVGAAADLLIFKLENFGNTAIYTDPFCEASGWYWILIGGEVMAKVGEATRATPGIHIVDRKR